MNDAPAPGELRAPPSTAPAAEGRDETTNGDVGLVAAFSTLEVERREVIAAQGGDRRALGTILRRHGPPLYRTLFVPRLGNVARAEDALATTYERAVVAFDRFVWQPRGVYPWLRVIAMRVVIDVTRSVRLEVPVDMAELRLAIERADGEEATTIETEAIARADAARARARVETALATLPARYALAIRRRILDDADREEAAADLGVSVTTFDVLLHRAMTAMRKAMESVPAETETP